MNAIKEEIITNTCAPEILIAIPPEVNAKAMPNHDPLMALPVFVLVYRFDFSLSEDRHVYKFSGWRSV